MAYGVEGPAELGRRLWGAFQAQDWHRVSLMLHPQAQLESSLAPGRTLTAAEALELWRTAIDAGRWTPHPVGWVELNDHTVLLTGALAMAAQDPGSSDVLVLVFRDGLLWMTHYYPSVDEALTAHPA